jgi:hypothetical protein
LVVVVLAATGFTGAIGYWFFLPAEERKWIKTRAARIIGHVPALSKTTQEDTE